MSPTTAADASTPSTSRSTKQGPSAVPGRMGGRMGGRTGGRMGGRLAPTLVMLLGVVMLVVGGLWFRNAHEIRSTSAAQNSALVDGAATAKVEADVSQALTRVLTYDYTDPDATGANASQFLRGDARKQYAELFRALRTRAADQKLTLTAHVRTAGVKTLHGDRATLLVFLDQTSARASDKRSTVAAAQVAITARDVDGTWRITGLRPL